MAKPESAFDWITFVVSFGSVAIGIVGTLLAKAFKQGKQEAGFEGQDKLFDNMLTNAVKEQVALKEDIKGVCAKIQDLNLRLTKLETMISERDKFQRDRQQQQQQRQRFDNNDRDRDRDRDRRDREWRDSISP